MNKETLFDAFERYDDERIVFYVTVYCLENDILVDTYAWDCLMHELYNKFMIEEEIEYEEFDANMCKYLI